MSAFQEFTAPVTFASSRTTSRSAGANAGKTKQAFSSPSTHFGGALKWTRKSAVLFSCVLTLLVISLDEAFLDWPTSGSRIFAFEDTLIFFALGVGSAACALCLGGRIDTKLSKAAKAPAAGNQCAAIHHTAAGAVGSSPKSCLPQRSAGRDPAFAIEATATPQQQQQQSFTATTHVEQLAAAACSGGHGSSPRNLTMGSTCAIAPRVGVGSGDGGGGKAVGSLARLNQAVGQAAATGSAERAGKLLTHLEAQGWESDVTSYNAVMRTHGRNGNFAALGRWFDRMKARGIMPNDHTFVALMSAHSKVDDVDAVERWMQAATDCGIASSILYNILIHSCAKLGEMDRAEHWLNCMKEQGVQPDTTNYNSLIHACGKQCRAQKAEELLEEMLGAGLQPTVTTYTALVDVCAKTLDVERAEHWLERMLENSVEPNVVTYSSMLNACAKVGDLSRAEQWYRHMQSRSVRPNAYTYSALINACAQVGDMNAACSWLQAAEQAGAALDGVVYGCVINTCGKVGDADKGMMVFKQMKAQGIPANVVIYGALTRPFAYRGDWEEVERISEMMEADGIPSNEHILYMQLLACSRARPRQAQRAEETFTKALEAGLEANDQVRKALGSAVGRARCLQLLSTSQLGTSSGGSPAVRCSGINKTPRARGKPSSSSPVDHEEVGFPLATE